MVNNTLNTDQFKALIEALENEKQNLSNNGRYCTKDHEITIEYLKNGKLEDDPFDYELLDAAVNDLTGLYNDYV